MKFITIGGVPAAGKTYTSKLLAKQNNFLALELETLRWDFFNNNSEENLYKYTQHASLLENENMREYYLRCALYENRIPLELFVEWHKSTMKFINVIQRFKQRENITENTFDKNIELYYKSYEEVLKDNVSNTLDTTDKDIIEKINDLI